MSDGRFILVLKCPDVKGVVAAVSGYLAENDVSIVHSHHFNDAGDDQFYMRTSFREDGPRFPGLAALEQGFEPVAARFGISSAFHDTERKLRVLIGVSKIGHCLYDLLHRHRTGLLDVEIPAVLSNHEDMRSFVEWNGLPYFHLPVTKETKAHQEAQILDLVESNAIDLVVLARYMQVLSADLCRALAGRCINIHHSFLPSFKGAGPYSQAHDRGVKIIGATAHYVTTDLDEGPIIEQGVERVSHTHTPTDLMHIGRDIECAVLARAVKWHVERRIMLNRTKTVVFA